MRFSLVALVAVSLFVADTAPRRVWTIPDEASFWGPVSPDGRFMPYGSTDDGNIYLYDLTTGAKRRLTNTANPGGPNGEPPEAYGDDCWTFSPDGSQLAYSWRTGKEESLRVVSLQGIGIQPPQMLVSEPDVQFVGPTGWSPDGAWVAFNLTYQHRPGTQIGLVSIKDATVRMIKTTDRDGDNLGDVYFSPDGRNLAYERSQNGGDARDVTLATVSDLKEVPDVIRLDGHLVGWTDAGLSYVHRTAGSAALFVLPVDNAKPGEPRRLTADLGDIEGMGVSASGAFYYRSSHPPVWQSSLANIDFSTGRVFGSPAAIAPPRSEANLFPASWSRDAKRLALVEGPRPPRSIYVRSSDTGELRVVPQQLAAFQNVALSPDGRTIATIGTDKSRHRGLFLLDVETGAATLAVDGAVLFRAWSAEGTKVYVDRSIDDGSGDVTIVEHDVASGAERDVRHASGRSAAGLNRAVSPDGRTLYHLTPELAIAQLQSLLARDVGTGKETVLVRDRMLGPLTVSRDGHFVVTSIDSVYSLVPTAGGMAKPVPMAGGMVPTILTWAPDGRSFLGRTIVGSDPATWQASIWWVPVDGRPAIKLDLKLGSSAVGVGSGGTAVAFVDRIGPVNPPSELWMLEMSHVGRAFSPGSATRGGGR